MRAAIFNGPRDITVGERPDPVMKEPTDAVVRVVPGCVCGSDLWYYRGESPHAVGSIGHEFIGVVEDLEERGMTEVVVVIGAGQIGQAIARRISAGRHVVLADLPLGNADAAAAVLAGTPDEVGTVAALLMSHDGAFITGSDILMDGGVTASYFYGELTTQATTS